MQFFLNRNIFKGINFYMQEIGKPQCDCVTSPPSIIENNKRRIVAIGDIHGDLHALLSALHTASVIDVYGNWIGSDTIVVQLGDQIDKGGRGVITNEIFPTEELQILEYLHHLHNEAQTTNGAVYTLLGNHEIMNIQGNFNYVHDKHIIGFGGYEQRRALFQPGGPISKLIACHSNAIMKIGNWVFVHAGLLPSHLYNFSIGEINFQVRNALLGFSDLSKLEIPYLWDRTYANHGDKPCYLLQDVLDILKIDVNKGGMVIGHSVQPNITHKCSKNLWLIDIGMSSAFHHYKNLKKVQVLEIINDGDVVNIIQESETYTCNEKSTYTADNMVIIKNDG